MLSRTAENLYWAARYLERADTAARLLDVGYRMSMMPAAEGHVSEWSSILAASGTQGDFAERYDGVAERNVVSHMVFDGANPSSIKSCVAAARHNARSVRTALTTEVWEAINATYHQFQDLERKPRSELDLPDLTDWTRRQTTLVRGAFAAWRSRMGLTLNAAADALGLSRRMVAYYDSDTYPVPKTVWLATRALEHERAETV